MLSFFDSTYDPQRDSGTSGAELTDLNPEQAYDTDLRRLDPEERITASRADTENARQQDRVAKYFRAAKSAGKFRQKAGIDEPMIRGKTPRTEAVIDGVYLPSQGDRIGTAGSTNYAEKPKPNFGMSYS
jgi:hypothetical protein